METTLKINQAAIANLLDVSESAVSRWLDGTRKTTINNAIKLSILTDSKPELWIQGDTEQIKELLNTICMDTDVKRKFKSGKITQQSVANEAQVKSSLLSQLLNGQKTPSWKNAKKLSQVTGIRPEIWMESITNNETLRKQFMEYQFNERITGE